MPFPLNSFSYIGYLYNIKIHISFAYNLLSFKIYSFLQLYILQRINFNFPNSNNSSISLLLLLYISIHEFQISPIFLSSQRANTHYNSKSILQKHTYRFRDSFIADKTKKKKVFRTVQRVINIIHSLHSSH